jgi:hypothetical protein
VKGTIRLSDPVNCGERTIVPLIRDTTIVSDHGGMVIRDPLGLVIMENKRAWFVSLAEGITLSAIDELLGIRE